MCTLLPAWLWLLLGLLPLGIQSRALTLHHNLTHRHRLTVPRPYKYQKSSFTTIMPTASDLSIAFDDRLTLIRGDRHIIWRALLHKEPKSKMLEPLLDESGVVLKEAAVSRHGFRSRRHANSGGTRGRGHLMRVGCVLGTCQVQNLSHRLYQLIGQRGREDSSPINPRSPHSYG